MYCQCTISVLPIRIEKSNVSSIRALQSERNKPVSLWRRANARNRLDFSIRIGSTPTFLYFDLYLNSVLETRVGVLGESGRIFWIFATRNNDSEILVLSVKFLESYKSDVRYTTILTCSPSYLIRELLSHDYLHGVILTTVIYRYPSKIPVIDPNHENIAQNVHELNCEEPVCIDVVAVVSVSSHVITIRLNLSWTYTLVYWLLSWCLYTFIGVKYRLWSPIFSEQSVWS